MVKFIIDGFGGHEDAPKYHTDRLRHSDRIGLPITEDSAFRFFDSVGKSQVDFPNNSEAIKNLSSSLHFRFSFVSHCATNGNFTKYVSSGKSERHAGQASTRLAEVAFDFYSVVIDAEGILIRIDILREQLFGFENCPPEICQPLYIAFR